jgi:hypothetical protein
LNQKSPIITIFNSQNLSHFENCAIAIKKARMLASDVYYQQTLNEIRICAKIGYHRNICTMLGYVSSQRLTCLLLELADTSLFNAIETMKEELQLNQQSIQDIVKYLIDIAIQIANAMVTSTFHFFKI